MSVWLLVSLIVVTTRPLHICFQIHKERMSPKDSQNAPVKTDVDKPGTPNSILGGKSSDLSLASVNTPEIKQSTPRSQITPRSILKSSKAPTPKEEIKRVSFIDAEDSDGRASACSTSSSIVLEVCKE